MIGEQEVLQTVTKIVVSEEAMVALGMRLGRYSDCIGTVFLQGELGVGKTTFVRSWLHGQGYVGAVKSPTYSLMVFYPLAAGVCYHLDLYRLGSGDESESLGLRDLSGKSVLMLIEWPEQAAGWLPQPDLCVQMDYIAAGEREITLQSYTQAGNNLLHGLFI
ncbi:MAG: tRNA (adenosine(37)-N6)-threonylcarbamoyltransferase complex ATPase subunit type 1 TsaE [Pseudomonadota bacterium]